MTVFDKLRVFWAWLTTELSTPVASYKRYALRAKRRFESLQVRGAALKSTAESQAKRETRCNHRKGGDDIRSVILGRGTDSQYAVIKHEFQNGDIWINCIRCGKKWKPGNPEYDTALQFHTHNTISRGIRFQWSDGGELYRKAIENS